MPVTPELTRTPRKVSLGFLLKTLDGEWAALRADEALRCAADADLLAYYHAGVRVALHWVDGCVFSYKFPRAYQNERLAKACHYLQKCEKLQGGALEIERDKQVAFLRETTWPEYERECSGSNHLGSGGLKMELTYTWSGIDSLWSEIDIPEGESPPYLPKFHSPESEAFHCNILAILFLNRATKRPLTDLDITPF